MEWLFVDPENKNGQLEETEASPGVALEC